MRRMLRSALFGGLFGSVIAIGFTFGLAVNLWFCFERLQELTVKDIPTILIQLGLGGPIAIVTVIGGAAGAIVGVLLSGFQLVADTVRVSCQALQREISDISREQQEP
jgi:hypothetical protein